MGVVLPYLPGGWKKIVTVHIKAVHKQIGVNSGLRIMHISSGYSEAQLPFWGSYYLHSMTASVKLTFIKALHTLIWVFYNVVIFYLLYAVIAGKIDRWIWIGLGLFLLEAIILLIFKLKCPLTIIARRYSDSDKDNFDIYIPNWLAKYNKTIYSSILVIIIIILVYQLI